MASDRWFSKGTACGNEGNYYRRMIVSYYPFPIYDYIISANSRNSLFLKGALVSQSGDEPSHNMFFCRELNNG
jgi:hypothetical protein